jgi:16S rRNA U516 pseudouridylate synthase RsuA-like enzyme
LTRGANIDGFNYGKAEVRVLGQHEQTRQQTGADIARGTELQTGEDGNMDTSTYGYSSPFDTKLNTWLEITLYEGKNREIRRIFEHFGVTVNKLVRTQYGPYRLTGLAPGYARELDVPVEMAQSAFQLATQSGKGTGQKKRRYQGLRQRRTVPVVV